METKICTKCNTDKPITEYDVRKNGYVLKFCKSCRRIKNNQSSKAHYQNNRDAKKAYASAQRLKPGYSEQQKKYKVEARRKLTDYQVVGGISKRLNLTAKEIKEIPGLIEAERSRLKVYRKIKDICYGDSNSRICSACDERKDISQFRMRTDKRVSRPNYTYCSGKCIECERKYNKERRKSYGK